MNIKQLYMPPIVDIYYSQPEGPLCVSGSVPDYNNVTGFSWDDNDLE